MSQYRTAKPSGGGSARTYVVVGQQIEAPSLGPGLCVVATPIGNLRDITIRALETLAGADVIACEDTRVTRKLLDHFGIATPLTPYHEHNAASARPKLLARLAAGESIALVSDAGTPMISDPGYKLVRAVCEAGLPVSAVPGPSAALAALAVAGRSEEHTSELQSLTNLVCRLLLEKKKKHAMPLIYKRKKKRYNFH